MSSLTLCEATRGVWVTGERRYGARFAIAKGVMREVYAIAQWHPAGSTPYETRPLTCVRIDRRWEFTGKPAPRAIRDKYVGGSVAHYFKKSASNPILYVNC